MITIICGEDVVASRNFLAEELKTLEAGGIVAVRLDGQDLTVERLVQELSSRSLLGEERVVVIEGLIKRKESQERQKILDSLGKEKEARIILWEKGALGKNGLKNLKDVKLQEFSVKPAVFGFLDAIGDKPNESLNAFHRALTQEPAEKLFAALGGRLHQLMIAVSDSDSLVAQGFYRDKLISQAKKLGKGKIVDLVGEYVEIDYGQKMGLSSLSLEGQLDIWLLQIYSF